MAAAGGRRVSPFCGARQRSSSRSFGRKEKPISKSGRSCSGLCQQKNSQAPDEHSRTQSSHDWKLGFQKLMCRVNVWWACEGVKGRECGGENMGPIWDFHVCFGSGMGQIDSRPEFASMNRDLKLQVESHAPMEAKKKNSSNSVHVQDSAENGHAGFCHK